MPCVPSAAASAPALKLPAQSAAKSPTTSPQRPPPQRQQSPRPTARPIRLPSPAHRRVHRGWLPAQRRPAHHPHPPALFLAVVLEPEGVPVSFRPNPRAPTATVAMPAGAPTPLTRSNARLTFSGYQLGPARAGQPSPAPGSLPASASMRNASALDGLAGEPITVDLSAAGPLDAVGPPLPPPISPPPPPPIIRLKPWPPPSCRNRRSSTTSTGKPPSSTNHYCKLRKPPLHIGQGEIHWDPVEFTYGPIKGTATLAAAEALRHTRALPAAL